MRRFLQKPSNGPRQGRDTPGTTPGTELRETNPASNLSAPAPRRRLTGARLGKFLSFYRPHLGALAADLGCAALVAATTLALPLCANHIVTQLTEGGDPALIHEGIYLAGALMLALIALEAASRLFVDYQGHVMGARMETDMREELFAHYQKLSFSFHDRQRVGQLMSRISNDLLALSELYHHGPEDMAISLMKFLGASAIILYLSPGLGALIVATAPFAALYALHFNERMGTAVRQSKERIAAINEHVEDSLSGIRVVKAFGGEPAEISRFAAGNARFLQTRRKGYRAEALFSVGLQTYTHLLTLMVILFGALAILRADMTIADLLTFLLCIAILADPIARAANLARLWQEGVTGFHRFMEVLEIEPEIQDAPDARDLQDVKGAVSFRDVSFRYAPALDHAVSHITLDIKPGEFVALVGRSGAGKTTLCSLVPRFYDASEGEVLIDGQNVKALTAASLRRNVGLVHQDVYLFAGSVLQNIAYGRPGATEGEIIEAAKLAHAHGFITGLGSGYHTDIGERGVQLSGGQKQRLTIARAFLKNPPILIFDEATSALDGESERAVQDALHRIAKGRTTIVIAHRLSTIMRADRIVVLTKSGIAEQGTHNELIEARGHYWNMHRTSAYV